MVVNVSDTFVSVRLKTIFEILLLYIILDSRTLPDIGQLLLDMKKLPYELHPAFVDDDYELKVNVGNMQHSIMER